MGRVRKYKKRKTLPKRDDDIHSLRGELVDEPIASLEKEDSRLSRSMRNFLQSKKQAARFEERQREKKREKRRRSETGGDNEQDTRGKKRRSGDGIRQESARNEKEIEGKEEEVGLLDLCIWAEVISFQAIPEQFEGESIQAYTRRLNEHTKNKLRKIEAQHHAMRPSRKAYVLCDRVTGVL